MKRVKAAWIAHLLPASLFFVSALLYSHAISAEDVDSNTPQVAELEWADLIPEGERVKANAEAGKPVDHSGLSALQARVGSIRPELSGQQVRIPGFVIPLEVNGETLSEFLLVPFYGACIHVPPPPPNQIIHVKFAKGTPLKDLWDLVYITGTINAESSIDATLGIESGYQIDGAILDSYTPS
ncbi:MULTISPECIES: DUF3299 domain-containing protein [unclassified Vibrio]|uniref:DUF3299 domain-containing protein n=1 Tax=Vibrio sp. HB236076 TaxID=3232307 RepID=A0AB39HHC4_9VIBR|nr:DUF3299 domain-containing protein [Vibrio sp. HB161653]MDP5254670.1 DUF3299 domain-containing protein [Vibrio sp. HB161653]